MGELLSSEKVVRTALADVGISENPHGSNITKHTKWYGMTGPWCAMAVSYWFHHGGSPLPAIRTSKGAAYCPDFVNWAKKNGVWRSSDSGYKPKRGDIVLFDFIGRPSHIGIVIANLGGRIQCVEGNTNQAGSRTGGSVLVHNRSAKGSTIGFIEVKMVAEEKPKPKRVALDKGSKGSAVRWHESCLNIVQKANRDHWSKVPNDGVYDDRDAFATLAFKVQHNKFLEEYSPESPRLDQRNGRASIATQDALNWWVRILS